MTTTFWRSRGGNTVDVSLDRRHMVIHGPAGQRCEARSARPEGFNQADIDYALTYRFKGTLIRGQVNRARRYKVAGRWVYLHASTGPPTWWRPQIKISCQEWMVGWLRAMVAVSVGRAAEDGRS